METPELDKIIANRDSSQAIGEFLEWLSSKGIMLCDYGEGHRYTPLPIRRSTEDLLAEYFSINTIKAEDERRMILDELRKESSE